MSLRRQRRQGRPQGRIETRASRADGIIAGLNPRHWYRADTYTLSGGSIATLPNRNTVVGGAMTVGAGTIAAPTPEAPLGGAPALSILPTNFLQSNQAASEFRYLHNGTGAETWCVFTPGTGVARAIWATKAFAAANETGAGQLHQTGFPRIVSSTGNGAVELGQITMSGGALGVGTYTTAVYKESEPNEILASILDSYGVVAATAGAPAAGDAQSTLRIGRSALDAVLGEMRFAEFLSFNRVLTPYERQLVREYIQTRYGIAAPVVSAEDRSILALNPFSWIRADNFTSSGGKVTAFLDKVLPGHSMTQATVANQVNDPTADAALGGQLSAAFVGTTQRYVSPLPPAAWTLLHNSAPHEILVPFVPTAGGGANRVIVTTRATVTGFTIYQNATPNAAWLMYNGPTPILFAESGGLSAGTPTYIDDSFDGTTWSHRLRGTLQQSGTLTGAVDPAAPEASLTLGTNSAGGQPGSFRFTDLLVFNYELSAASRDVARAYLNSRYNLAP